MDESPYWQLMLNVQMFTNLNGRYYVEYPPFKFGFSWHLQPSATHYSYRVGLQSILIGEKCIVFMGVSESQYSHTINFNSFLYRRSPAANQLPISKINIQGMCSVKRKNIALFHYRACPVHLQHQTEKYHYTFYNECLLGQAQVTQAVLSLDFLFCNTTEQHR